MKFTQLNKANTMNMSQVAQRLTMVDITENDSEQSNRSDYSTVLPCGRGGAQGSFSYAKTLLRIHKLGVGERRRGGTLGKVKL